MAQKQAYRIINDGVTPVNWVSRHPINRNYGNAAGPNFGPAIQIPFQRYRICSVIYMTNVNMQSLAFALQGVPLGLDARTRYFEAFIFDAQNDIRRTWTSFYPGCPNRAQGVNFGISTRIADNHHVAVNAYPNPAGPIMMAPGSGDVIDPLLPVGPNFTSNFIPYNNRLNGGPIGGGISAALAANPGQATGVWLLDINVLRAAPLAALPPIISRRQTNQASGMPQFFRTLAVGEAVGNAFAGGGTSNVLVSRLDGNGSPEANIINRRVVNLFSGQAGGGSPMETPGHEFGHMMGLEDRYMGLGYLLNRTSNATTPLATIPLNDLIAQPAPVASNLTITRWRNNGFCMIYGHRIQPNPPMYLPGPFSYRSNRSTTTDVTSLSFNHQGNYLPPYLVPNFSQFYDPEYSMYFGWMHNLMSTAAAVIDPSNPLAVPPAFNRARFRADPTYLLLYNTNALFHGENISTLAAGGSPNAMGISVSTVFITAVQLNIILDNEIVLTNPNTIPDVEEIFQRAVRSIGVDARNQDLSTGVTIPLSGAGGLAMYRPLITHSYAFDNQNVGEVFTRWTYFLSLQASALINLMANPPFNNNKGSFIGLSFNATDSSLDDNRPAREQLHIVHDDKYAANHGIGVDDVMDFRMVNADSSPGSSSVTRFLRRFFFLPNTIATDLPGITIDGNLLKAKLIGKGKKPTKNTSSSHSLEAGFSSNRAAILSRSTPGAINYDPQLNVVGNMDILTLLTGISRMLRGLPPANRATILAPGNLPNLTSNIPSISTSKWLVMWDNYINGTGSQPIVLPANLNYQGVNSNLNQVTPYLNQIFTSLGIVDAALNFQGIPIVDNAPSQNADSGWILSYEYDMIANQATGSGNGTTLNEYYQGSNRFRPSQNSLSLGSSTFRANIWNGSEPMWGWSSSSGGALNAPQLFNGVDSTPALGAPNRKFSQTTYTSPQDLNTANNTQGFLPRDWDNVNSTNSAVLRFFIHDAVSNNMFGIEIILMNIVLYRNRETLLNMP
jgi:hypothetical protein